MKKYLLPERSLPYDTLDLQQAYLLIKYRMDHFIFFDTSIKNNYLTPREGETKLGEVLPLCTSFTELEASTVRYVIIGIPEDIGIQANYGKPGADRTWSAFLKSFLNLQWNTYTQSQNCTILGQVDCDDLMQEAQKILCRTSGAQPELGALVSQLDQRVTSVIQKIVSNGKTPIIIGGGHNNSYGNIKGTSQALHRKIDVLNIDAHTDLRHPDYRHSGNGFSFAKQEGYLDRYLMFGIHKNYTPQYIFDRYGKEKQTQFKWFEELMGGSRAYQLQELQKFIAPLQKGFGLEIDCDAIENFPSSAKTPSGFSLTAIRGFIGLLKNQQVQYLHLAEAADLGDGQVGKALSYLVADFMQKESKTQL